MTGDKYNQVSAEFFNAVARGLSRPERTAADSSPALEKQARPAVARRTLVGGAVATGADGRHGSVAVPRTAAGVPGAPRA